MSCKGCQGCEEDVTSLKDVWFLWLIGSPIGVRTDVIKQLGKYPELKGGNPPIFSVSYWGAEGPMELSLLWGILTPNLDFGQSFLLNQNLELLAAGEFILSPQKLHQHRIVNYLNVVEK